MLADRNVRLEEAYDLIKRAVDLEPDNGAYLDSLGWVFYRQGRFDQAKDSFDKAIKLLPEKKEKDDAVIFDHLAETDLKTNHPDDAVAQWKLAVQLDPDNKDFAAKLHKYETPSSGQ